MTGGGEAGIKSGAVIRDLDTQTSGCGRHVKTHSAGTGVAGDIVEHLL